MSAWSLIYESFSPDEEGQREALCTLGNGYLATRGAAPESRADEVHNPGSYGGGLYNRLRDTVDRHTIENESLVNLPNWLPLTFRVEGGPWFDLSEVDVLEYRQELDLLRGVLVRVTRFRAVASHTTRLTQRRFVHMGHAHLCGLQTTVVAENWSGRIDVRSALDGTVENSGVERYRKLAGRHLQPMPAEAADEETLLLVAETAQSHIRIAEAARTRVLHDHSQASVDRTLAVEPGWVAHDLVIDVAQNEPVIIDKVVAVYNSRDRGISEPAGAAVNLLAGWAASTSCSTSTCGPGHGCGTGPGSRSRTTTKRCASSACTFSTCCRRFPRTASTSTSESRHAGCTARRTGATSWDELFVFPILNLRFRRSPGRCCATGAAGSRGPVGGPPGRVRRRHVPPAIRQ